MIHARIEGKSTYHQAKGEQGGKQKTVVNHFSVKSLARAELKRGNKTIKVVMGNSGAATIEVYEGDKLQYTQRV